MNGGMIRFILGSVLKVESVLLLFPCIVAVFYRESAGYTTTGASILSDVECLSQSILFWRSFSHWIGGMGVLVFLLAIIPLSGGSHMNLM